MKKAYIIPAITLTKVELQNIMAGSLKVDGESNNFIETAATGDALARKSFSVWSEEEEEE